MDNAWFFAIKTEQNRVSNEKSSAGTGVETVRNRGGAQKSGWEGWIGPKNSRKPKAKMRGLQN